MKGERKPNDAAKTGHISVQELQYPFVYSRYDKNISTGKIKAIISKYNLFINILEVFEAKVFIKN